jgi:hypothetical protein
MRVTWLSFSAIACGLTGPPPDRREHVVRRRVVNGVRGVEPQPVEVVLVDPVAGVGDEVLAHAVRAIPVEVQRLAPFIVVLPREVVFRVLVEHAAVGPEVVVDDVENHGELQLVRTVDEGPEVIRTSVQTRGRVWKYAVVTPPELSRQLSNRHHLHNGDPQRRQVRQLVHGRTPRPGGRERPDVQLVHHLPS